MPIANHPCGQRSGRSGKPARHPSFDRSGSVIPETRPRVDARANPPGTFDPTTGPKDYFTNTISRLSENAAASRVTTYVPDARFVPSTRTDCRLFASGVPSNNTLSCRPVVS